MVNRKALFILVSTILILLALPAIASAGSVEVNGNTYNTLEEAIANGGSNTYTIYGKVNVNSFGGSGTSTFIGGDAQAEIVLNKSYGESYGEVTNVTFKNLTFTTNNALYKGFHGSTSETFIDCTINGEYWCYSTASFTDCVFNQDVVGSYYNVRTYGSSSASFKNCIFNAAGRFILVYSEDSTATTASFTNCKFIGTDNFDESANKAAVEADSYNLRTGTKHTVTMKNCEIDCRIPAAFRDKDKNLQGQFNVCSDMTDFTQSGNIQLHNDSNNCGHVIANTNSNPAVLPQTGDNSHLAFFAALLAFCGAGLMALKKRSASR